ncbi:MAG: hypothetical protein LW724_17860 [Planctomycetaceae bacterium]|jgi:uncharacterized membrane protein YgdD (TMEM256/DUF423 family)|nr:hypothetical protein [Planctomycetaceae bacterium]
MRSWGIYLLIFGIGSFLLPMMGLQFKLLSLLGNSTPIVGGVLTVAGIVLLVLSSLSPKR